MRDSHGRLLEGGAESGFACRQRFNPIRNLHIHAQHADRLAGQPDNLSVAKNPQDPSIPGANAEVLAKARLNLK
jgi:hypothetical protein